MFYSGEKERTREERMTELLLETKREGNGAFSMNMCAVECQKLSLYLASKSEGGQDEMDEEPEELLTNRDRCKSCLQKFRT